MLFIDIHTLRMFLVIKSPSNLLDLYCTSYMNVVNITFSLVPCHLIVLNVVTDEGMETEFSIGFLDEMG